MRNKARLRTVNKIRLAVGWFGMLTPVFGAGVLVGVGLTSHLSELLVGQVVVVSAINFFVGRMLLKPVPLSKGKRIKSHG